MSGPFRTVNLKIETLRVGLDVIYLVVGWYEQGLMQVIPSLRPVVLDDKGLGGVCAIVQLLSVI